MPLATAFDIDNWAGKIAAPGDFPRLVRRLVLATAKVSEISFPADEGVWQSGWDGRVTASGDSAFVPSGNSKWELGVGEKTATKAKKDIRNRADTPAVERAQTTFLFVTPRSWPKKAEWQKKQRAEAGWRDVRAYDAHDLETWLEQARAAHVWFSSLIGVHTGAESDFDSHWDAYSKATRPALPRRLLLEGREKVVEKVRSWARSEAGGSSLALQAESREEAIALFIASLLEENEDAASARGLVVSNRDAWNNLAINPSPLLLVPAYPAGDEIFTATTNGHRVLVPLGYSDPSSGNTLEVPRLPVRAVAQWLEANGIPTTVAWENAKIARRSLTAFRRLLAERPELRFPSWASPAEGPQLTPFLLAGSWEDSNHSDCNFLAQLAGQPYHSLEKLAQSHCNATDSLLRRLDSTWLLVSRADAWGLLGRYVTESEFGSFERLAAEVLHPSDPSPFEPLAEVFTAPAERTASRRLVQSIAETLALLGSNPDLLSRMIPKAQGLVGRIVRKTFEGAASDVRRWAYLCSYGVLTDLALADPDAFLRAVERANSGQEPAALGGLFTEANGAPWVSHSPHVDLLWALAALAWSPSSLGRVVTILAKLVRLDPGGNVEPRPRSVLQAIFHPRQPATSASWQARKAVLERLHVTDPEAAVSMLQGVLNARVWRVPSPPHPRWSEWAPNGSETSDELTVGEQVDYFVAVLLSHSKNHPKCWPEVIRCVAFGPLIPEEAGERLLSELNAAGGTFTDELRREIVSALRLWRSAIPPLAGQLEDLIPRLEPDNAVIRHTWLFSSHPELPEYRSRGLDVYDARVLKLRTEALPEVLAEQGLTGLLELARSAKDPDSVGYCLGHLGLTPEFEASALEHLGTTDLAVGDMLHGFCRYLVGLRGEDWTARQAWTLVRHGHQGTAAFLQAAKPGPVTWGLVEELGPDVRAEYWRKFRYCFVKPVGNAEYAIRELLAVERPDHALQVAHLALPELSPELAMEVLEAAIRSSSERTLEPYSLKEMLQFLQSVETIESERLYPLEWYLLPLCDREHHEPLVPIRILRDLARNPASFAQVACWANRAAPPEPAAAEVPAELRHQRHENARRLLRLMEGLPGTTSDGSIDADFLRVWLLETERLLTEQGRGHVASRLLGEMLGQCSPLDADGSWPHQVVRDLLEASFDPEYEAGFCGGAHHRFGQGAGRISETIRQNRELATQFKTWGQAIITDWPRTSAALLRISKNFELTGTSYERVESQYEEAGW